MLEKIILENLIVKEHTEYTFTKEGYILDQNCTWDEWYDFSDFIKKLSSLKNVITSRWLDEMDKVIEDDQKESILEIHYSIEGEKYKYILNILQGTIILESIRIKDGYAFCRLSEEPEFFINEECFTKEGLEKFKGFLPYHNLVFQYSIPGQKLYDELQKIIYYDLWRETKIGYYMDSFESAFGESYSKIINKAIQDLGFGDDYISVDRKTGGMISKTHPGITIEFEVLGSGLKHLCKLVPLLYVSKKYGYSLICPFFDMSLDPFRGEALWKWYTKDLKGQIITRLQNVRR
jgi:hypothetical protein